MSHYTEAPRADWDCTVPLMREGYRYIGSRCERLGTDVFRARLMLKETLFLRGEEAAQLFYDKERMTREQAAPKRLQKTLFGEGGVQGLEGESHRRRKALFLSFMAQPRIDWLMQLTEGHWQSRLMHWEAKQSAVLFDELHLLLCRAACEWCGIPLDPADAPALTRDLVLMIEGGGTVGPRHWASRRARHRTENALIRLIEGYRRTPTKEIDRTLPLPALADFRDANGAPLADRIVAVELLNLIRPIAAVARYMVFVVLALHEHPACRERLTQQKETVYRRHFIQEIRRYYPFFPFIAARVRKDFVWRGYRFRHGTQVILDLYGTNHDPNRWGEPDRFRPERFERENEDCHRFAMIPQGGGEHATGHRCPGEWITLALIDLAIDKFVQQLSYRVPDQNLSMSLGDMPAKPKSGMVIDQIRPVTTAFSSSPWQMIATTPD